LALILVSELEKKVSSSKHIFKSRSRYDKPPTTRSGISYLLIVEALNQSISIVMSAVDYLLHESSVGYAVFEVVHQPETIGNRLKEVQDAAQDLAKFGKMIKLVSFAPWR